ncbi:MAG: hypothetical protein AAGL69_06105 [Pseudomonadota bacterium]
MATLTAFALEKMGFVRIEASEPVTATLHAIHVGELTGLTVPSNHQVSRDVFDELPFTCKVGVGNHINPICKEFTSNEFCEDEEEWAKNHKASAPYVITAIGPTDPITVTSGWVGRQNDKLLTYNCFSDGKRKLHECIAIAIPRIYSALVVQFSDLHANVDIKPLDTAIAGKTDEGEWFNDFTIEVSASASVSSPISDEHLENSIDDALKNYLGIDARVSRFLYCAETDQDPVKRFLYYFLALEIFTHQSFKRLRRNDADLLTSVIPDRLSTHGQLLTSNMQSELRALVPRFVWCACASWSHVSDSDVDRFRKLKKIRDDIVHGNKDTVDPSAPRSARELALHVIAHIETGVIAT